MASEISAVLEALNKVLAQQEQQGQSIAALQAERPTGDASASRAPAAGTLSVPALAEPANPPTGLAGATAPPASAADGSGSAAAPLHPHVAALNPPFNTKQPPGLLKHHVVLSVLAKFGVKGKYSITQCPAHELACCALALRNAGSFDAVKNALQANFEKARSHYKIGR